MKGLWNDLGEMFVEGLEYDLLEKGVKAGLEKGLERV